MFSGELQQGVIDLTRPQLFWRRTLDRSWSQKLGRQHKQSISSSAFASLRWEYAFIRMGIDSYTTLSLGYCT
jgi:hypothetical protein